MQKRCDRNRKRSKRRAIYCPTHGCAIDSVSQKYSLFADQAGQLQQRGISRRNALTLIAHQSAVPLSGEWLEAFWCEECQESRWYHVRKREVSETSKAATYEVSIAPPELWQQVTGVPHPNGNPSVGEFTRRQSRMSSDRQIKDFCFVR
ncbi:MAG: hypothetical protein HC895_00905 [Leptolyngbyaceae cyanobacterium SM1_3_5]|nr:hypothetical protein [Leptolyngbyaceae cyanobacterium SM1_3_5]